MKKIPLFLITLYRVLLSPVLVSLFGHSCRYSPTCSEYSRGAINRFGIIKGSFLTVKRIVRCNPFFEGGYDPVKI